MNKRTLINTVIKILGNNGYKSEKIHVQKFISFLSCRHEDIPFHFKIYKYGPFSSDLSDELNSMVLWGDIRYEEKQYVYEEKTPVLNEEVYKIYENELKEYADLIGNLSFENMEIYGTLFYLLNEYHTDNKEKILDLFHDKKKNKYQDKQLESALQKLLDKYTQKLH